MELLVEYFSSTWSDYHKTLQYGFTDDVMTVVSLLLTLCENNPHVIGGFPSQMASNECFGVSFDVKPPCPAIYSKMRRCI